MKSDISYNLVLFNYATSKNVLDRERYASGNFYGIKIVVLVITLRLRKSRKS